MIQFAEKHFRKDISIAAMAQGYRPVHDVEGKPRDGMLRRNGFSARRCSVYQKVLGKKGDR